MKTRELFEAIRQCTMVESENSLKASNLLKEDAKGFYDWLEEQHKKRMESYKRTDEYHNHKKKQNYGLSLEKDYIQLYYYEFNTKAKVESILNDKYIGEGSMDCINIDSIIKSVYRLFDRYDKYFKIVCRRT